MSFHRLLLATGGTPQRPYLPGKALHGVQVLRSLEQAATLVATVEHEHQLVIIGNSFIGMEVAAALRKQDIAVTVVSLHPLPFEKQFGTELGTFFRRRHQEKGVTFVDGEPAAFEGDKRVSAVTLKDGRPIKTTLVLLATGVAPATQFIHDLPLNDDGSLTVDATMQVTEDIYAIGDIATFPFDGKATRIEHWRVAQQHWRVAAAAMMDKPQPYDAVPFFWTQHYDVRYEYLGHAEKWDLQEIIGSLDKDNFVSLYGLEGNLVAVVAAGRMRTTGVLLLKMGAKLGFSEAQHIVAETGEPES
nr:FAD-dependent oxidoreductase [Candidatus Sodalis endolongispinus]